jgi:hypothetical protein
MPPDWNAPAHAARPEPWRSFLRDFDRHLKGVVEPRCFGGFVVDTLNTSVPIGVLSTAFCW